MFLLDHKWVLWLIYILMFMHCLQDLTKEEDKDKESPESEISQEDLPKLCPGILCKDKLPSKVPDDLFAALQRYVTIVCSHGRNVVAAQLATQICAMIRREHLKAEHLKLATKKGWPITTVDFKDILGHIVKLEDQLCSVVYNKSFCEWQLVWKSFEGDLATDRLTLGTFAHMGNSNLSSGSATFNNAHPG